METSEDHWTMALGSTRNAAVTTSLEQLLADLGGISASRVRCEFASGTATVDDLLRVIKQGSIRCELVDGTLVEKAMGWRLIRENAPLPSFTRRKSTRLPMTR